MKKHRFRKYNVEHKRDKKKEEIVQAAVQLFIEKGFDRISLSDIARKVNLRRTTIYEYFNNKNEILASYLEKEMTSYHEKVKAIMAKKAALQEKLREFITLQLEYSNYHKGFSRLLHSLSRSAREISDETEAMIREKHQEIYAALINQFSAAIEKREIRNISSGLVMQILINATSFPIKSGKDLQQTAGEVLSLFWSGISKK